ncbi:hypothetical protein IEQ34_016067 [Dendrobium chrysotoxum]|uniref:Protein N-terminal glutamine amidohydrolase n=1 Tax=Dendrobium chrysotoxum TaxID=161865 RepID=A0AAV7GFG7_DENCH|nr:hypothetical protein IEQ34_016067 [Dendrobium chrysotoxum]
MAESSRVGDDHRAVVTAVPTLLSLAPSTSGWNSHPKFSSFTHTPFYCEENVYLLCKKLCMLGVADPTALDLFVVFISNDHKKVGLVCIFPRHALTMYKGFHSNMSIDIAIKIQNDLLHALIPLWNQKASKSSDKLVIWDYHVICIQIVNQKNAEEGRSSHLIWDLDSNLPFPLPLDQYVSETFRLHLPLMSTYKRILRVIHAPIFLQHFASNRTHMRDPHGNWIAPPPNYEPIIAQDGSENNLDEYVRIRAADAMTDINALVDGLYSNKYGVLISEAMLEAFFSLIH